MFQLTTFVGAPHAKAAILAATIWSTRCRVSSRCLQYVGNTAHTAGALLARSGKSRVAPSRLHSRQRYIAPTLPQAAPSSGPANCPVLTLAHAGPRWPTLALHAGYTLPLRGLALRGLCAGSARALRGLCAGSARALRGLYAGYTQALRGPDTAGVCSRH